MQHTLRSKTWLSVPYDSRGTGHNWIRVSADGPVSVRVEHGSGALVTAATSHFCSFGVFVPVGSTYQLIVENDTESEIALEYNVHSVCGPGDLDRSYVRRGGGCVSFALALAMAVVAFFTQIALALNQ